MLSLDGKIPRVFIVFNWCIETNGLSSWQFVATGEEALEYELFPIGKTDNPIENNGAQNNSLEESIYITQYLKY